MSQSEYNAHFLLDLPLPYHLPFDIVNIFPQFVIWYLS